jgi:hypothetical protein
MDALDALDAMNAMDSGADGLPSEDFILHMKSCPHCRREWNELREVWEALAWNAEEVEVPRNLKTEVMQAVFGEKQPQEERSQLPDNRISDKKKRKWNERLFNRKKGVFFNRKRGVFAAGIIFVAILLSLSPLLLRHINPAAIPQETGSNGSPSTPAQQSQNWQLLSYSPEMPSAAGKATLRKEGTSATIEITITGLKPTVGNEAYQAWLLHDGQRDNCGTFHVGSSGKGTLTYNLADYYPVIDGIGITLEPDAQGLTPRGPRVAGTRN